MAHQISILNLQKCFGAMHGDQQAYTKTGAGAGPAIVLNLLAR